MDDDDKKSSGPKGRKPGAGGARGGRPQGAGGKPAGKRFGSPKGGKPAGDRPFSKRPPRSEAAGASGEGKRPYRPRQEDGEARSFRPRREDGEGRPFKPRRDQTDGRPFRKDDGEGRERPASAEGGFRKGPRPPRDGGERKPFRPRGEPGDRPAFRKQDGDRRERPASADGGFRKGPRKPWSEDGERKQFRPRRDESAAPQGERKRAFAPRRLSDEADTGRDDGRPFRRREDRDGEDKGGFERRGNQRPGRAERGEGSKDGFKPRSFGMKRHAAAAGDGSERPRSYGMKSHDGARQTGDKPRFRRPEGEPAEAGERIAKRLARAGIASRREAEDLVAAGRVRVNGKVLSSPAFNVAIDDRIELDGTEIPPIERTRLFLFHKPGGVVTTNYDPEGRKTVFDVLPEGLPRLMTVGRLDINTEGLLLLTNDGGLARVLELPATGWLRRYRVRVHGSVDEKALAGLQDGIAVDGVFYGAIEAALERVQGTNAWLTIGLREGKNREVKNVLGALGLEVNRLIRVSFGPFQLGELPEGQVQELKGKTLRDQLGERLIEDAGANFEAPIVKPFSNKAEQVRPEREERPRRERGLGEEGEGGLIKNRRRSREDRRDDALGRLSTKPQRGFGDRPKKPGFDGKPPRGREGDREGPAPAAGPRKANVWMAPGARPQGKKPAGKAPGTGGKPGDRGGRPGGGRPRGPRKD